ncbi:MAG: hypothetical protein U0M06_10650 [Clostridia bacterium]|nr:hypothetical protein [Clostridia bacterium]
MKMNLKEFWKYYSYGIVRIFVDQLAIAIFAFALCLGFASAGMTSLTIAGSAFAVLFFMFMVAQLCFKQGVNDREKTELGRFKRDNLTGLYMGLLANVPNFVLAIGYAVFYSISATRGSVSGFFALALKLITGEYIGLLTIKVGGNMLGLYPISYFLIMIPGIFSAFLGYYLGVTGKIVIKPTKKDLE